MLWAARAYWQAEQAVRQSQYGLQRERAAEARALALTPFIGAFSLIVVGILAAWKEGYDYLNKEKHTPDLWDWIATVAGGIVGYLPYIKI